MKLRNSARMASLRSIGFYVNKSPIQYATVAEADFHLNTRSTCLRGCTVCNLLPLTPNAKRTRRPASTPARKRHSPRRSHALEPSAPSWASVAEVLRALFEAENLRRTSSIVILSEVK